MNGADDLATAELIERARLGERVGRRSRTAELIANSDEATRTLTLGDGDVDRDDIAYATRVDAFDFAMEVVASAIACGSTRPIRDLTGSRYFNVIVATFSDLFGCR